MAENVVDVTDDSFDSDVLKSDTPVLVDFWATWCGPCKALAPTLEAIAGEKAGALKVCKVDVDNSPQTAAQYGVRSIPTMVLFKGGEKVDQLVGNVAKGQIEEMLKKV